MRRLMMNFLALSLLTLTVSAQTTNNECDFQMSFISPFGTNGAQSHLITNRYSLNILGGYSAGNRVVELGSLYNVNVKYTAGVQAAGVANYTGNSDKAVQLAGIINIANEGETSFQGAGIANVTEDVIGMQAAGIVNVATDVNGVQLGLINIADSYEAGVPIGLISIVKSGGKQQFEVSFSEAINTAVAFKLGTDKLYTIFSGGVNYIQQSVNYAAGLGFGTEKNWGKGWGNQIEIIGYTLTEDGSFDTDLNMLSQLKFTFSKDIAKHFKIFFGPVVNMTISKYLNPETCELGSSVEPWSIWKNRSNDIRLNSWIGFSTGVRF